MFAQQNKLLCKAILVGDTNTGKTYLLNRLVDKVFTDTTPTLGSSLKFESVILNRSSKSYYIYYSNSLFP